MREVELERDLRADRVQEELAGLGDERVQVQRLEAGFHLSRKGKQLARQRGAAARHLGHLLEEAVRWRVGRDLSQC